MPRAKKETSYLDKLEQEVESNQSKLSLILGGLIMIVVAILIFNYINRSKPEVGPSQQTEEQADVSPENLPGQYTVKEGDTLFTIAKKYYQDGYKYQEIAKANELSNVDTIEVGQVLQIPKLAEAQPSASPEPETATGGGDTTIWGPNITADTYTVVEGDWLSTIAGRAYGDISAYTKLAEVNSIPNPDLIYPGQVLQIPR